LLTGDDLTIVLFFVGTAVSIAGAAMSAAGWKHPLLIWILCSLAGICLVIGVAWPIVKTVSPPATAAIDQIATNPVAWFAVLILGMTASILLPKRRTNEPGAVAISLPVRPTSVATAMPTPPKEKLFIDVSPAYLTELYKNRTSIQGDVLASAFMGKWISATGSVSDVTGYDNYSNIVLFDNDRTMISAVCYGETKKKADGISKGRTVTVEGEISAIDDMRVRLENCEIKLH
jgi:hypothetical protein